MQKHRQTVAALGRDTGNEIGIRVALGADRRSVAALVFREGMSLVGLGLAIGLGAGFYLSESVKMFLFDVNPRDLTTFAIVPCVLATVAPLACYVPARCALRVDPLTALKHLAVNIETFIDE
jgi:putative ABC transport system permease protein